MLLQKLLLFITFILSCSYSIGQVTQIDSLKQILEVTKNDKEKVESWNALTKLHFNRDLDSANFFNQKAIGLAQKNSYPVLLMKAKCFQVKVRNNKYQLIAANQLADSLLYDCLIRKDTTNILFLYKEKFRTQYYNRNLDSAFYFLNQGLRFIHNNPNSQGEYYVHMAAVYKEQDKIPQAIELSLKAMKLCKQTNNKDYLANLYGNLGLTYMSQHKYEQAIEYLNRGKQLSEEMGNLNRLPWHLGVIGLCYRSIKQYEKSFQSYKSAIEISEKIKDERSVFYYKNRIIDHYLNYKFNDSTYQITLQLMNEVSNMEVDIKEFVPDYYLNKAIIDDHQGLSEAAIYNAERAYQILSEQKSTGTSITTTKKLSSFYKKAGNYKKAYEYHVIYKTLEDSLMNRKNIAALEIQEAEHEFAMKETLQQQKLEKAESSLHLRMIVIITTLLILGLVTAIALILRRNNQLKTKQNELLEEKVQERTDALFSANEALEAAKMRQRLEDAKSRFFANVSHEFRTPLTLIHAPLDSMIKSNTLDNKNFTRATQALQSSEQMNNLVNQILDLTKFDAQKLKLNESIVPLYLTVRRTVSMFESSAQQKGIQLTLEYKLGKELQVEIDKEKFNRILTNYLSNAIKYTPKGGQIKVQLKDFANTIQCSVKDNGIGIPVNLLETVFERYYQVSDDIENISLGQVNHYAGGTGIGLALCKEYAQLFDGKVWAESNQNNNHKGSTFYFEFPKKEVFAALSSNNLIAINKPFNQNPVKTTIVEQKSIPIDKSTTILLVEDNIDLRIFLGEVLNVEHHVVLKENGQAALEWLENTDKKPDLIISDVMMPLMNGFELLEKLKSSDEYRHIPVMMLTARADMKDKLKALRIGVDDYILKPFNETELNIRINNNINNYKNRAAIIEENQETEDTIDTAIKMSQDDQVWLENLENCINKYIDKFDLNASFITDELFISRSQLFKKTKLFTGLTFNQYVRETRLQKAKSLLEIKHVSSVKVLSYSVGFRHTNYFSKLYTERFGKRPSDYF